MTRKMYRWMVAVFAGSLVSVVLAKDVVKDSEVFTLYSNAPSDRFARIHEATFDTRHGAPINSHHCERIRQLLQDEYKRSAGMEAVKVWCEKGRYRP